jgi:hypothetical protein
MNQFRSSLAFVLLMLATAVRADDATCNAAPDAASPQYVIGYGSLMQDESRKRTAPEAGPAYPVLVRGYRRGWFARGKGVGCQTTFLGVVADAASELNAVVYQLKDVAELQATDRRESIYCRRRVPVNDFKLLGEGTAAPQGEVWIYVNSAEDAASATARYPIVQSYVDIFLSGCLEQEQRFKIEGYVKQCIATTGGWPLHWVNDRLYPRRPFIHQPKAFQIDKLLSEQLPEHFRQIRIDSGTCE